MSAIVRADMTSDGIALYKGREFSMAASVLEEAVVIAPENDTAHYYLSLSLAQMGKADAAVEALGPLMERDPCYYRYKIDFDPDFDPIRQSPDMAYLASQESGPTPLAVDPVSKDQICQTSEGLFLYRRGLRILLAPPSEKPYQTSFVDDDSLYFVIDDSDDPKKPNPRTVLLSREGRKQQSLPEGTTPASLPPR